MGEGQTLSHISVHSGGGHQGSVTWTQMVLQSNHRAEIIGVRDQGPRGLQLWSFLETKGTGSPHGPLGEERQLPRLQSQTVHELRRHGAPPNPPLITASVVCQKCKFSDFHLRTQAPELRVSKQ